MTETFVNCTPHAIRVRLDSSAEAVALDSDLVLAPCPSPARMALVQEHVGEHAGVPLSKTVFGELENLPDAEAGVFYVVSTPAAQKAAEVGRHDVVSPSAVNAIRAPGASAPFAVRGFQVF